MSRNEFEKCSVSLLLEFSVEETELNFIRIINCYSNVYNNINSNNSILINKQKLVFTDMGMLDLLDQDLI